MKRGHPGQADLYDFFGQVISKTAIVNRDDEWVVRGKWCIVALDEQTDAEGDAYFDPETAVIDIWICNPKDMINCLGQRKVNNIVQALESRYKLGFHRLTGEAWGKTPSRLVVLENLDLLGIRRKRVDNPERRQADTERLRKYREAV